MPVPLVPISSVPQSPGVYPILGLAGTFTTDTPNPGRCYLITTGSSGLSNVPVNITSLDAFVNYFDATPSTPTIPLVTRDAVKAFFNITGSIGELYVIRVPGVVAPAVPTQAQYIATLNAFNDELPHGYLICPEAYALLKTSPERVAFQVAVETFVSQFDYQWVHLVDAAPHTEFYNATNTTLPDGRVIVPSQPAYAAVTSAPALVSATATSLISWYQTDVALYTSSSGHCAYVGNWGLGVDGRLVPVSTLMVAVAQVRYYQDSFRVAPAGVKAPCKGLVDVAFRFSKTHQAALNGSHVNILRFITGYGVCVYGERTLYKQDSAFRFIHTRVIMNVLVAALRTAYLPLVFDPIDGQGVTFQLVKQIATQICTRFWQGGALYGQSPDQAFLVRCDSTNNLATDLELGILRVDVYAAPVGVAERILVGVFRTAIGQIPAQ